MSVRTGENNWVSLIGVICSDFRYSHDVMGERFYLTDLSVARLSKVCDMIPLLLPEQLIDPKSCCRGSVVEAIGQFRSYSYHDGYKSRLLLSVFTRQLLLYTRTVDATRSNQIYLDGYLCKKPVYRKTPMGREIVDLFMAVNRPYGKSDYIPCIAWGANARFAAGLEVSTHISIWGRIQSREYSKKLSEELTVRRMAYEVSIHKIDAKSG